MDVKPDELDENLPRRLVMRAEYGAEHPFWTECGTLLDDEELPLPEDLRRRIRDWAEDLWGLGEGSEADAWHRKGLELHREVVNPLGPRFEVVYDE